MEIWTQLSQSESKKRGLDKMLNRYDNLIVNPGPLTVYIPSQFWFCRNIGLALPLIALQYHDVTLEVNFRTLAQMYTYGANQYYNAVSDGTNILQIYKPFSNTPNLNNTSQAKIMVFPDGNQYYINPTATIGGIGQTGEVGFPYLLQMVQNVPAGYSNASVYIKPNGIIDTLHSTNIDEIRLYIDYIYLDTIKRIC
jgi:hypothetical protein